MVVLIVEPDTNELHQLNTCVQKNGHMPITTDSITSALRIVKTEPPGLVLLGLNGHMPQVLGFMETIQSLPSGPPVIALSRKANLEDAVELMKAGAHDFWVKPVSAERLSKTIDWLQSRAVGSRCAFSEDRFLIVTQNERMAQLKLMAKRVAPKNAPVFIQGESGTGKELFARYIHQNSDRCDKPFIGINCAALPESLIESELFGHEKGAFTGAIKAREGKFELAHTGTLFLDEITEIPIHLQSKLLRVLQESEVDRVGGKHPISIDVRVIASTNVALDEALKAGRFRRDLYYRLNVIPIKVLPLRERREDIPLLCRYFIEKYNHLHQCSVEQIAPQALKLLQDHPWPGNVRELENVIQRAMLFSLDSTITAEHILFDEESELRTGDSSLELMPIDEMEKRMIHKALASLDGNRTRAAEILGISVRTLRNKLNEYGASETTSESEM
jgi:DNA-binding NtrC family response regulator